MKPFGVKRNWNVTEEAQFKNATRASARRHAQIKKQMHRAGRRTAKHQIKITD